MIRRLVLLLLACVAATGVARAQTPEPVYPKLSQPVTDTAGVIDADSAATLDQRLRALRAATKDVIAIVTVPTIEPAASVEAYAVKLFEQAGIGNRELDNGVLILVAVKEHGIRIEVGYGLEGVIPDGFAGETIRQFMVPEFKAGRYGAGLVAGSTRLIQKISEGRQTDVEGVPQAADTGAIGPVIIIGLTATAFVIGLVAFLIRKGVKSGKIRQVAPGVYTTSSAPAALAADDDHRRAIDTSPVDTSSSSSSSSDAGGFDGGSSGGGGASGSW